MRAYWERLGWHGRATYLAHLYKACVQQHHRDLTGLFRRLLTPDAVVVDVGAHGGQFAKLFARLVPAGAVHAFEPSGYARSILRRAVRFNRLAHVRIHAFGLSDEPGERLLTTPIKRSGAAGFGTASLVDGALAAAGIAEPVALRRLDDVVLELGLRRLDLIKADIEGWEMHLLRGARHCLERLRPALFLELSPDALARAGDDAETLTDFLAQRGYRPFLRSPDPDGAWHPVQPRGAADVLWLTGRHAPLLQDGVLMPDSALKR